MPNCEHCGRPLAEGEVCDCTQATGAAQQTPEVQVPAETVAPQTETAVEAVQMVTEQAEPPTAPMQEQPPVYAAPVEEPPMQTQGQAPVFGEAPVQQQQPAPPPAYAVNPPIYGYTAEGYAIYGYTPEGQPVLQPPAQVQAPIYGYTQEGYAIYGYTTEGQPVLQPPYFSAPAAEQPTYGAAPTGQPAYGGIPNQPPKPSAGEQFQQAGEKFKQAAGNVAKSPMVGEAVADVKGMLSKNPEETIKKASEKTGTSWVILGAVGAVLSGLFFCFLLPGLIASISGGHISFGDAAGYLKDYTDMGGFFRFFVGFFYKAIDIAVVAALVIVPMQMTKKPFNYMRAANMVVAAMVPSFALYILCMVLSLFWATGALYVVSLATVVTFAIMYQGIMNLGEYEKPHTWAMSAYFVAVAGARALLMYAFSEVFSNILGTLL